MKKVVIFLAFSLIIGFVGKAQSVVTDPSLLGASLANWAEQLSAAASQYSEIQKQSGMLQENIDRFKKVNAYIKNFRMVANILNTQVEVLTKIAEARSKANENVYSEKAYSAYINRMEKYTQMIEENIEMLETLLSDDGLSMNDYERLQTVKQTDDDASKTLKSVTVEARRYQELNRSLAELERLTKEKPKK